MFTSHIVTNVDSNKPVHEAFTRPQGANVNSQSLAAGLMT